jgi:hypothetical protein
LLLNKKKFYEKTENIQVQKQKNARKIFKLKRALKFFGSIMRNIIKSKIRNHFTIVYRNSLERPNRVYLKPSESNLDIAGQQGFVKLKSEEELEVDEESSFINTIEVRRNQMNAYLNNNSQQKGSFYGSGDDSENIKKKDDDGYTEDEDEDRLEKVKQAISKGKDPSQILEEIQLEINKMSDKLNRDDTSQQSLSLKQRIDMLTQLTNLIQLLKNYHENFNEESFPKNQHNSNTKKNFERILKSLQNLIQRLLQKLSGNSSSEIYSNKITRTLSSEQDQKSKINSEFASLAQIDEINKNITNEIESLARMIDTKKPTTNQESLNHQPTNNYETHQTQNSTTEFQSINKINILLNDMVDNIAFMNGNLSSEKSKPKKNSISLTNPEIKSKEILPASHFSKNNHSNKNNKDIQSQPNNPLTDQFNEPKPNFISNQNELEPPSFNQIQIRMGNNMSFGNKKTFKNELSLQRELNFDKSELLNFFGVLNFKIKRYNKKILLEAFDKIFDVAAKKDARMKVFAFGSIIRKDLVFDHLERMKIEVNRRVHIKNHFVFKIAKSLNTKKKKVFKVFRNLLLGNDIAYGNVSVTDAGTYVGNFVFFE